MSVICPHCNSSFELMPMEEIINPTLTISRKIKERSSWEEIADVINRGEARRLFDIGDSISCTLKNGKDVNFIITAINPYQPNQVAFEFADLLPDTKVMNNRNTNRGGWAMSAMKEYMKEVFALLPDDLQKVIVPRKITQKLSDGSQNSSEDNYLWLRSMTESGRKYETDIDDVPFPFFTGEKADGCVRLILVAPLASGLLAAVVASAATAPPTRLAFAPASLSVGSLTHSFA